MHKHTEAASKKDTVLTATRRDLNIQEIYNWSPLRGFAESLLVICLLPQCLFSPCPLIKVYYWQETQFVNIIRAACCHGNQCCVDVPHQTKYNVQRRGRGSTSSCLIPMSYLSISPDCSPCGCVCLCICVFDICVSLVFVSPRPYVLFILLTFLSHSPRLVLPLLFDTCSPSCRALQRVFKGNRTLMLTRSSFPGVGKYSGHWLGDNAANWNDIKWAIPGMLEFGLFGVPYVSSKPS